MIKNIIFDIDGVLIDRDGAFANYLRQFPQYQHMTNAEIIKEFKKDIPGNYLPLPDEITGGKTFESSELYYQRPVFDGVIETLTQLKQMGINAVTLSATSTPEKKEKLLRSLFGDLLKYEFSELDSKEYGLRMILDKYNFDPNETIFIDDNMCYLSEAKPVGIGMVHCQTLYYQDAPDGITVIKDIREILELIK